MPYLSIFSFTAFSTNGYTCMVMAVTFSFSRILEEDLWLFYLVLEGSSVTFTYLHTFESFDDTSNTTVSVLQMPLMGHALPLHEYPAPVSGVGPTINIFFTLGVQQ